ncbi:complex I NDUFA9 subunit family protein [Pelagibacterium montanilacus]|uniref:complex I NDUFA9 subunit family protein n=1 Tax=Pelagibacterium montanilacus TaxID=2185280 RepID=UPI000F8D02E6|nr:complex I NDUFA9 subunit family protein [Pelagibacterium montanilacus]
MTVNSGKLATIFGGSGFVGTQVVQELARRGYRIRVAVRRPDLAGHVRMFGFPGQIQPIQANLRYPESVAAAVAGADLVVNLVGILFEKGRQKFDTIQTQGAATVATAARQAGASHLVHMSAIGADTGSPSAYARSKARGEAEVLKAFPEAVIIRPSIIFGPDDGFFNLFGSLARYSPVMPLVGGKTRFQPVYVADVAQAFAIAAEGRVAGGTIYELGGPDIETMRQLIDRVLEESYRKRLVLPLPDALARLSATMMSVLPKPMLTPDQITQLGIDNVVSEAAIRDGRTFSAFGIAPTGMDAVLSSYMWRFRKHGEFERRPA